MSMLQLAQRVIDLTGSASQLVFKPLPNDDPRQRCPDITRARDQLGWAPTVALDEGLKHTIAHLEQLLRRLDAAPAA